MQSAVRLCDACGTPVCLLMVSPRSIPQVDFDVDHLIKLRLSMLSSMMVRDL